MWTDDEENILKGWADKATCFKWMHDKAYNKYYYQNAWLVIPVIIFSTMAGTANFAQERFPPEYVNLFVMIIGSINIISGVISTVGQFLKVSERLEGHRMATISWDKYARYIKLELNKSRTSRLNSNTLMKICKEQYDRLIEISPNIPTDIVNKFNRMIVKNTLEDIENENCLCCYNCFLGSWGNECHWNNKSLKNNINKDLELPEICGVIKPTKINRSNNNNMNWYDKELIEEEEKEELKEEVVDNNV